MYTASKTNLLDAKCYKNCVIVSFDANSLADIRLQDLGFVKGTKLQVLGKALFNQTVAVKIRNATVCIRKEQASKIFVREI